MVNRDNVSSASINSSTRRTQLAELTFTGFNSGESVIFTLDPDTASNDAVVDYRDILIANPDNNITPGVVRITFSNGEAESFELTSSDGTRNNPVRYTQGFNDFSNGAKNLNDGTTIRGADPEYSTEDFVLHREIPSTIQLSRFPHFTKVLRVSKFLLITFSETRKVFPQMAFQLITAMPVELKQQLKS